MERLHWKLNHLAPKPEAQVVFITEDKRGQHIHLGICHHLAPRCQTWEFESTGTGSRYSPQDVWGWIYASN